jgi:hypothetical protein
VFLTWFLRVFQKVYVYDSVRLKVYVYDSVRLKVYVYGNY